MTKRDAITHVFNELVETVGCRIGDARGYAPTYHVKTLEALLELAKIGAHKISRGMFADIIAIEDQIDIDNSSMDSDDRKAVQRLRRKLDRLAIQFDLPRQYQD